EGVAATLMAIVDRATASDPDSRYQGARELLEALDSFIVGERSANKGDAPARQLAAWLGDLWKDERDEAAIDDAIEGDHLVSFLDDGALDVIGTGTQRSMLATAAEPDVVPVKESPPSRTTEKPMPVVAPPAAEARRWKGLAAIVAVVIVG